MAIEVEERLVKEIDRLSERFDDLDKRMRSFETVAKAGLMVALIFGITFGVGGYFLKQEADAIQKVREDTQAITTLESRLKVLQEATAKISANVEGASLPVLVTRINTFASANAPEHYSFDTYTSEMQSLSDFTVEYLALIRDKRVPFKTSDSNAFFKDLRNAADAAKARAKSGLKNIDKPTDYPGHIKAPDYFKDLLTKLQQQLQQQQLQQQQSPGLTDDELHCYMAAFPNWAYHITHDPNDSPNSPNCRNLLKIGAA